MHLAFWLRATAAATALVALAVPVALAQDEAPPLRPGPAGRAVDGATAGARRLSDVPYGLDLRHRMDVYVPAGAMPGAVPQPPGRGAPVVFMVHGGAWSLGDNAHGRVVHAKVGRWVPRGLVVISVNYRLVPAVNVLQQAHDVATALATAQRHAAQWGADASRFILMGHSAGAHLVALLNAHPALAHTAGARPWLGAVALDSAALDVPRVMAARHPPLYDRVFGDDPAFWRAASPNHAVQGNPAPAPPFLLVCSTRRTDGACAQAQALADRVHAQGGRAEVLPQPLSHGDINARLGEEGDYTRAVERFMASLDPEVARLLR
jgi:acetyl esterase/lipase